MNRKFLIITTFCILYAFGLKAQQLVVETKTGDTVTEFLSNINQISFPNNNLVISNTDQTSLNFNLLSVKKLYFNTVTGIHNDNQMGGSFVVFPNPADQKIEIQNLPDKSTPIIIYNIQGVEVYRSTNASSGNDIDISQFHSGVYFVRIEGETVKFIKL